MSEMNKIKKDAIPDLDTTHNISNPLSFSQNSETGNEILDDMITSIGSFRRLILAPEPVQLGIKIPIQNEEMHEYEQITERNIERRRITFKDDALSKEFVDIQPWKICENATKDEAIDAYKLSCFRLKIRPSSQILEQLENINSSDDVLLEEFQLRGLKVDSKFIETLDEIFKRLRCSIVNFAKCSLEDDFIISICEMVEYYQCARHVIFAHNPKVKIRGWIHLGRMLRRCPFVENIDIGYCAIDNLSLPMFLRCIRSDCCLIVLHIEGNGLSGKGILILLAAMKCNTHLKELYLGRNNLNPEDASNIAEILKNNVNIEVLDLRDNSIQDRGLGYLINSIGLIRHNNHLNSLFLTNNSISECGIDVMIDFLKNNSSLRTLSLSGNNIGNLGVQKLKPALLSNSCISKLGVRNTRLSCEGAIALAEVLVESRTIEVLDLRGNDIRIAGLMALSLAHKLNRHLLNLQIPENIKADQRDRQLIIDVLNDLVNYRARNQTQREAMKIAKSFDDSTNNTVNFTHRGNPSTKEHCVMTDDKNLEISLNLHHSNVIDSPIYAQNVPNYQTFQLQEELVLTADPSDLEKYQHLSSEQCSRTSIPETLVNQVEKLAETSCDSSVNLSKIDHSSCVHECNPNLPDLLGELSFNENKFKKEEVKLEKKDGQNSRSENMTINDLKNQKDSIYKIDLVSSTSFNKELSDKT